MAAASLSGTRKSSTCHPVTPNAAPWTAELPTVVAHLPLLSYSLLVLEMLTQGGVSPNVTDRKRSRVTHRAPNLDTGQEMPHRMESNRHLLEPKVVQAELTALQGPKHSNGDPSCTRAFQNWPMAPSPGSCTTSVPRIHPGLQELGRLW